MNEEKFIKLNGGEYFGPVDANNLPHGFGQFTASNGNIYSNEFVHGTAHGDGVFEIPGTGNVYCTWVNGDIQGRAEFWAKDGSKYELIYKNGEVVSQKRL